MSVEIKIPMKINEEKKHSVRYDAIDNDAAIRTTYIMKTSLPSKIPQYIIIKLEMENE